MVTFAQAQERAEEWINGDVPSYQHREVRVREFELGFVVWAEDRAEGPRSDGGGQRLVIARDSGEATLWPSLPVGEVIRRYEEEYGRPDPADEPPPPAASSARVDLNQTSFLLSPPEWLQEAADKLGIGERPGEGAGAAAGAGGAGAGGDGRGVGSSGSGTSGSGALPETQPGVPVGSGAPGGAGAPNVPAGATPWAGTDTNADAGEDRSVPLPATVFAPPLSDIEDAPPSAPSTPPDAETALISGGSQLPPTAVAPALDDRGAPGAGGAPGAPAGQSAPGGAGAPGAHGVPGVAGAHGAPGGGPGGAPGALAGAGAPGTPPPPPGLGGSVYGYPQGPGGAGASGTSPSGAPAPGAVPPPPPPPGAPSYGYPQGAGGAGAPGTPPGASAPGAVPPPPPAASSYGYPQAPGGAPGMPQPPGAPRLAPNAGDIADAATSKAAPPSRRGSATPPPPSAPGTPGARAGSAPPPPPGPGAGGYVPTQLVSALGPDGPEGAVGPQTPGAPQPPGAPNSPGGNPPGDAHHAATVLADPGRMGPGGGAPQPPGAPGVPGAPAFPGTPGGQAFPGAPGTPNAPSASGAPGAPGMPSAPGAPQAPGAPGVPGAPGAPLPPGAPNPVGFPGAPQGPGAPGAFQPPGASGAPGTPGASQPPGAPGMPITPGAPGAVHHAETVLAAPPVGGPGAPPVGGPGVPPPPPAPGALGAPGAPGVAPGVPGAPMGPGVRQPPMPPGPGQPSAYGYPQQPAGQPAVGPGYQAVLRYRAQDGSEQQVIRRSAPGTPHPEWQIFHELRAMNVPPDQVLELHTELESCELPGAYCARMIREQWPQARITSIAPYGTDHASRQQGMRQLLAHQGELHQVADGPARPAPVRAPLPPVQAAPPVPPEAVAQELAGAFGPGVFRFEQAAVSRQGVPPIVAQSLVVAGLPLDMGPFFWAQAQPGRPVPTLAELAQERGVQPASDAASYLVMGSDFGKALCVQYGTANIVAVPVEAGPGGAPVPPQFVNTGLPEFQRCLALLGRMWRLRFGLNQEQAGRWTVDFQAQLASLDPAALGSPESWWSVLLEQMWDGLL
ncbi:SUKH-4 family immunity protein [Streptomyces gilvus]|uniref:SUKH-4 family immunity protein n=1 Tax=Streptomyces gilvus TaxID=2920937 RepID=UPI001F0D5BF1|nr:SUKH-4 family immunity protein [Streptomyces sp. CME 23]MCH5673884.1 SUKH-4 family immunity protein [Streptomyces sp. CME 23]